MKLDLTRYNVELIDLFGIEQEFKLCHIPFLVADDVLGALALEGSSGTGKTTIINRVGKLNELLTGGRVKTYSADKARYEDFNGCPLPNDETKQMVIYPMPNSVSQMETVLVDEINRASYENQEKWLSLFATRRIDGLETNCRYIYAAMNPVMVDTNNTSDTYEGVQPLDKALGERMMGLVRMTPFHKMTDAARLKIIMGGINQANWKPTDEAVQLFSAYISRARELYNEAKVKYASRIAAYIDAVQQDLKQETKSTITIEARRGQYIFCNVLAIHALDNITNKTPLETSAMNALLVSFPNPLWEQPINPESLKQAHHRAMQILKLSPEELKRSVSNFSGLERPINEIIDFASKSPRPSKEQLSKVVSQNIPSKDDNPANHYIFCLALYEGLTANAEISNGKKTQSLIKEQDFARLEKSVEKIINSPRVKEYKELHRVLKQTGTVPSTFKLPEYLDITTSPEVKDILETCAGISYGVYCLVLAEFPEVQVTGPTDIMTLLEQLGQALQKLNTLRSLYNKS